MSTEPATPHLTSFAPQFLVDDLERSIAYYREALGFEFGEPWGGFYAIGVRDGLELHLKHTPKDDAERRHRREQEHLDAAAGVEGIEAFYSACVDGGAMIVKPLAETAWGTLDFYVEIRTATSSASAAAETPRAQRETGELTIRNPGNQERRTTNRVDLRPEPVLFPRPLCG